MLNYYAETYEPSPRDHTKEIREGLKARVSHKTLILADDRFHLASRIVWRFTEYKSGKA